MHRPLPAPQDAEPIAQLRNPGIVRNRLKIVSAVKNANAFLNIQKEFSSFDRYIWQFTGGKPRVNAWRSGDRGSGKHSRVRRHE